MSGMNDLFSEGPYKPEKLSLRLLSGRKCLEAEGLWREVFCEDSEAFTDYYFSQKADKNRGFVLEGPEGIRSMLYLTPEHMRVGGQDALSAYIVGVATRQDMRHRGYMRRLLEASFGLLLEEKMPFTFLMPASPDIYRPFGFTWIYDKPCWDAQHFQKDGLMVLTERDADRMAAFASSFLKGKKSVYVARDCAYYKQQVLELTAQEGCIFGAEDGAKNLQGLWMYTQEDGQPEFTEVLAEDALLETTCTPVVEKKPAIMARIICAERMLSFLRSDEPVRLTLRILDPLIKENNGVFFCQLTKQGAAVERLREDAVLKAASEGQILNFDITELTAAIFGYGEAKAPFGAKVRPLSPVWINEIV